MAGEVFAELLEEAELKASVLSDEIDRAEDALGSIDGLLEGWTNSIGVEPRYV